MAKIQQKSEKSPLLAEYFLFWTNSTLFCPLWDQGSVLLIIIFGHLAKRKHSRFEHFFTVNDGGYNISLSYLFNIIMQEVAVEHRHVGNLAELDGTHTMLLTELTGHIDSHGKQRLLTGDGLLHIAWSCCSAK